MGKGLIPADPETWKIRRRAIVPGFHKAWLNRMMRLFAECADTLVVEAEEAAKTGEVLDMEEKFCSLSLDIIGRAVFNYDFGSVSDESPVIKAVYRVLREAEHRSSSFIPYWKVGVMVAVACRGGAVAFGLLCLLGGGGSGVERSDAPLFSEVLPPIIGRFGDVIPAGKQ